MKTKEQGFYYNEFQLITKSDTEQGRLYDTKVYIKKHHSSEQGILITVIAGSTLEKFVSGLSQLIDECSI